MSTRRWLVVCALAGVLVALAACAGKSRHEVLSFFFDGVPPEGSASASSSNAGAPRNEVPGAAPAQVAAQYFPHTPYRENKCEACHDATSGQLVRPIEQGLCLTCHGTLVESKRFVHAPVAVGDCSLCHHHHGSNLANLLLVDPVKTCLNCHERSELSDGSHHAQAERACNDCHDPHGGDDRFFVKRSGP